MTTQRKLIRASELGEYAFCARAWRLRADGVEHGSGHEARQAGTDWHRRHGKGVVYARRMRRLATWAGLAALALAAALALLWWRG